MLWGAVCARSRCTAAEADLIGADLEPCRVSLGAVWAGVGFAVARLIAGYAVARTPKAGGERTTGRVQNIT